MTSDNARADAQSESPSRDEAPQFVLPLVVRIERGAPPTRTDALEAAARALHVTPSAISQRLRALEVATGRILLVRTKPVQVTESGRTVLRLARQVDLLTADVASELGGDDSPGNVPTLPIAVNADSMATWVLPALAPLAGDICFDLYREDQEHTSALLRAGTVMAAVTAEAIRDAVRRATGLAGIPAVGDL